jgi:muramoyltetrapeptide carboxypeptidase LdcA involved in peptidoglycan recycling
VPAPASPWENRSDLLRGVRSTRSPSGVPVLYGLPTGHAKHLATLPWA